MFLNKKKLLCVKNMTLYTNIHLSAQVSYKLFIHKHKKKKTHITSSEVM